VNVFLINGSPKDHRSNTYRLSSAFLDGLRQKSELTVKEVCAAKLDIRPCLGCFGCWNKTPGKCCIEDSMAEILENMLWADVILWSFPLYYFSVPGPLKNLMDRQLPLSLPFMTRDSKTGGHPSRFDMSRKRHVVISTCGFYTAEGNYDGVDATFTHMCGKYTSIYCGQGELFRVKELSARTDEYLSWVRDAGAEFAEGDLSAETRQKLKTLLYPRDTFEAMADASWGVEESGEKTDESLIFTRQMAALYQKSAWPGKDLVLEMRYTDIDRRYQILLQKDGSRVLSGDFLPATTIIETPYTLWQAIAAGEEQGDRALMEQKYRVKGDFSLMVRWDAFFGSGQPEIKTEPVKKTNMLVLLLPWILFWTAVNIHEYIGPVVTLVACAAMPGLFRNNRWTVYDFASSILSALCCAALLLVGGLATILPLSYLCFGCMWIVGGLQNVPMTAHYSVNDYGSTMMENPIFIKTNRILTLCWGVVFLFSGVCSWCVLRTDGLAWLNSINSILPLFMGVFTAWFQKWYPAHIARGKN